uniref:Uncharacterized protein n=1 Tax=Lepeophtheirus salmonis TaxID=72036 RepID=A0A0K2VC01_LEPSM
MGKTSILETCDGDFPRVNSYKIIGLPCSMFLGLTLLFLGCFCLFFVYNK